MESIALQETALSHILCAESRKMQKPWIWMAWILQAAGGERLRHQYGARRRKLELVLKDKLEFVSNNLYVPGDSGCHHLRSNVFCAGRFLLQSNP